MAENNGCPAKTRQIADQTSTEQEVDNVDG